MTIIKELIELSNELNLDYEPQDWGIINSSSERVEEFIDYFNNKKSLQKPLKYQLFELIIASFNDCLLEKKCGKELKLKFTTFLEQNSNYESFQPILYYWKSLEGVEYPISQLL